MSTTQLGLQRIEELSDVYCLGTLPSQLNQTELFSRGVEDEETGTITHELSSTKVAVAIAEIQAMAEKDEEKQALSQAINVFVATTRTGRHVRGSKKVILNRQQKKDEQLAKASGRGGRGGNRGRNRGGRLRGIA